MSKVREETPEQRHVRLLRDLPVEIRQQIEAARDKACFGKLQVTAQIENGMIVRYEAGVIVKRK